MSDPDPQARNDDCKARYVGLSLSLADILQAGGINHHINGNTSPEVIAEILARFPLPQMIDRQQILSSLLEREAMASSALGEGVAIPHSRDASLFRLPGPLISLNFLQKPLEIWGNDFQTVAAVFLILCPNAKVHLQAISKLSAVLRKPSFKALLVKQADGERILAEIRFIETAEKSVI